MAGMETTTSTLVWTPLMMDDVIGNSRLRDLGDKKNLRYLEAAIAEILRASSLVPLAFQHKAKIDTTPQGYHIPKGTTVLVNLWSLHQDTEIRG